MDHLASINKMYFKCTSWGRIYIKTTIALEAHILKIKKTNLYWHKGSPLLFIINKIHTKKYVVYSFENTSAR
jgi:hypothetical protein